MKEASESVTVLCAGADPRYGEQVFYCTNNCTISLYSLPLDNKIRYLPIRPRDHDIVTTLGHAQ